MTDFTSVFRRETYAAISPLETSRDQSGRTILITGGSEGIGNHIAYAFANAGASKIVLVARNRSKLDESASFMNRDFRNTNTTYKQCDLNDETEIRKLWSSLADDGLFINVLVLSAGPPPKENDDFEGARASIHFGIISQLQMFHSFQDQTTNTAVPKFLVNITTAAVHCYPFPVSGISASRAGFVSYLGHISDHIPENQVRIVNLHPGCVYTQRSSEALYLDQSAPIWDDPKLSAHMAVWVTDRNHAFLHGRFIWSNWDTEQLLAMKDQLIANPGLLKIGITGVSSFELKQLFAKCEQVSRN